MATILIADCEPQVNDALATHFEYKNFEVFVAWKAVRIVDLIYKYKFDMVIMDVQTIDGLRLDLLEWLKKRNPNVKIIVMSTYFEEDEMVSKIKAMGADEYLPKPISVSDLDNLVMKYTEMSNSI